jgi:hypothetical protein
MWVPRLRDRRVVFVTAVPVQEVGIEARSVIVGVTVVQVIADGVEIETEIESARDVGHPVLGGCVRKKATAKDAQ